jgi:hypothetical protein
VLLRMICQRESSIAIDGGDVAVTTAGASGGSPMWYFFGGSGGALEAPLSKDQKMFSTLALMHN